MTYFVLIDTKMRNRSEERMDLLQWFEKGLTAEEYHLRNESKQR